jgi:hypothetical protein
MTSIGNYLFGSQIIQAILPTIVKDNIEVASFIALLTYVLFLINWLVSTDWLEKVSEAIFASSFVVVRYSRRIVSASLEFIMLTTCMIHLHYY